MRRIVMALALVGILSGGLRAYGECHEMVWLVNEISYWGHVFGFGDRYSYARWWYGGPVCLDGGMVY